MTAPPLSVAERVLRHLTRYRDTLREALTALDAEGQPAAQLAVQQRYERVWPELARERMLLLREWEHAAPDTEAAAQVRALAMETDTLNETLRARYADAAARATQRREETQSALGTLRRGRNMLAGYRSRERENDGHRIDRQG